MEILLYVILIVALVGSVVVYGPGIYRFLRRK